MYAPMFVQADPRARAPTQAAHKPLHTRPDYDFAIGAACFPEVHPAAVDADTDIRFLKEKVDAGARFLITQLFFDNEMYFDFVARAHAAGIDVPIGSGAERATLSLLVAYDPPERTKNACDPLWCNRRR